VNGEAIYDTHNWTKFGEGGGRGKSGLNIRFTVKGENLYAIILGNWPGAEAVITSLAAGEKLEGKIATVTMLGSEGRLKFTQDDTDLKVKLPATAPCKYAYVLKITGLKMNPPTWTASGNPQLPPGVGGN
jgi:alpha-L-fucosidase